jgi:CRISPR-associated protein Csc2
MTLKTLEPYQRYFVPAIPRTPTNRYASIILLRETKSYAIFTTEGGEQQDVEQVPAGLTHSEPITSAWSCSSASRWPRNGAPARPCSGSTVIFPYAIKDGSVLYGDEALREKNHYDDCYLTERLCTHCPDCLIYGYAAVEGRGGAAGTPDDRYLLHYPPLRDHPEAGQVQRH